jgi:hypothetical protein
LNLSLYFVTARNARSKKPHNIHSKCKVVFNNSKTNGSLNDFEILKEERNGKIHE